jgi:hypothetical protein
MFGTVFRAQVLPGRKDEFIKVMMDDSRVPKGMRAAYLYDTGSDEVWGVAMFDDEATYRANASSPEQDAEYRKMRALLAADPEWHDGTILAWPGNRA